MVGLTVDVEQNGISGCAYDLLQIRVEHRVCDFVREKVHGPTVFTVEGVLLVLQQVGEDLDEVRLATAEEARDPYAVLTRSILLGFDGFKQHCHEIGNVGGQFTGDDKLVELLPHRGGIELVGFNHAVNGSIDVAFEKVLDFHTFVSAGIKVKAR